ncbi:MAG TPA: hypothetical protein VEQ42_07160 [Pyrinomonadaceae bacterium]|nr:hypothetical protein [Pyrinomonadaceae bacterium]
MKQKRYCPKCQSRVSRNAGRCHYCGRRLASWKTYALLAVAVALAVVALLRVVGFW